VHAADPALAPLAGRCCLVTGGLGFIGANLVHALVGAGAHVRVVDALVPEHGGDARNLEGVAERVAVTVARIDDVAAVAPLLDGVEVVFNVAGQVSHLESMADPLRDLDLNARSHLAFLELLRHERPEAVVVHTSTRQVYGRPRYLPVDEEHPAAPVDVNGIDKLAGEQFHLLYHRVHELQACALRLTNVYGPRQNLAKDGLGFLPVFVRRALAGAPIALYGDGSQLRDCLHVDDVVRGLALAATCPDAAGEVFNLGHPEPLSLAEIAAATVTAAGSSSPVTTVPWPAEQARIDIGSFHGDFSKAKRVLGWEPHLGFAAGIADTIAYYRAHPWAVPAAEHAA
jgi:nucleoside-diphosphate-sugar epimerase